MVSSDITMTGLVLRFCCKLLVFVMVFSTTVNTGNALSCFVCKKSSEKNYAEAESYCNAEGPSKCHEEAAKGCMVEGFQMEFMYHVVKRCVMECPVFVNSSSELIRCCAIDGCNDFISKDIVDRDFRRQNPEVKDRNTVKVTKNNDQIVNNKHDDDTDTDDDIIISGVTSPTPSQISSPTALHSLPSIAMTTPANAEDDDRAVMMMIVPTFGPPASPPVGVAFTTQETPGVSPPERGPSSPSSSAGRTTRRPQGHNHHHRHHQFRNQFDGSCRGSRSGSKVTSSSTFALSDLLAVAVGFWIYALER